MADSTPYTEPHFSFSEFNSPIRPKPFNKGKSYYNILFRSLFFALFLIALPLFPSQAPEFINQTIFTKFWELLHLLFIGIAVAYGLFSRRNLEADIELETHSSIDADTTPNYVSSVFPDSLIFGHGHENQCGSDEKRMMHCWNYQYFEGMPGVVRSNGSAVTDECEQYKPQLLISGDNFGESVRYDGANVVKAWNSEYYHSEPVVVVAQSHNNVGDCGEVIGYKPLGLPVRSLRSVSGEVDSPRYANESDSSSGSRGSSKNSEKIRNREFGDPLNSPPKFNDAAGSASPIPWHSRCRRMEREGKHGNVFRPSHFRPLSVDETKFESLSSGSLQSTTSFSYHTSMYSSLDSISPDNILFQEEHEGHEKISHIPPLENMNFQVEDSGKKKTSQGSTSRYGRMTTKGRYTSVSRPSHFRPISVDETQFEKLSSGSLHLTGSFSSQASICSSLDPASSENVNLQEENLGAKLSSHGSSSSSSPSPPARRNEETSLQPFHSGGYTIESLGQDDMKSSLSSSSSSPLPHTRRNQEASFEPFHSRGCSIDSLLQDDLKSNLKDDLRSLNGIGGEDPSGNKMSDLHSLQSDSERPASLAKAPSKGKSVRTRRASGLISETMRAGEICSKQTDEKVEKMPDNVESVLMRKDKMKSGAPDRLLRGFSKKNPDGYCSKPELTFSNHHKRDKLEPSKDVSKEGSDIKLENFQEGSDEDRVSECVNDSGLDSEVDKKAGEFIAKFKAQIRLQKVESVERSNGQRTTGNYVR